MVAVHRYIWASRYYHENTGLGACSMLIFFIFIVMDNGMNEILKPDKKLEGLQRNIEMIKNFQNVLQYYELLDKSFSSSKAVGSFPL